MSGYHDSFLRAENDRSLNDFKVAGLQPRIAELAFNTVYGQLHGQAAQENLRDLNLERINRLPRPWSLASRPDLPAADWRADDGQYFDVKCNLFYRSKKNQCGLRGLLIDCSETSCHSFPGLVFTDSNDYSCAWVYVGEYNLIADIMPNSNWGEKVRVLPFCFRLPDKLRFTHGSGTCNVNVGLKLLSDRNLRIGWQLAVQQLAALEANQRGTAAADSLLNNFVERCLVDCQGAFLEYALWKALTATTLDACSRNDPDTVQQFLQLADDFIASHALPIKLPRIDKRPILGRWIAEVLIPLSANWSRIKCLECRSSAIELSISSMTSEGTICTFP